MGTIPIHMWSARVGSLEQPDWLVLDLDPKGAPFTHVVEVARALHGILDELELPSYPKTSGATGLHILIPLGARYTHEETRTFARLLATLVWTRSPRSRRSRARSTARGQGLRRLGSERPRHHDRRAVLAAAAAGRAGLVSAALERGERPARSRALHIETIPKRFEKMEDPLAPVLAGIDMAAAIARIERGVARPRAKRTG